jgi:hypothetical protein
MQSTHDTAVRVDTITMIYIFHVNQHRFTKISDREAQVIVIQFRHNFVEAHE